MEVQMCCCWVGYLELSFSGHIMYFHCFCCGSASVFDPAKGAAKDQPDPFVYSRTLNYRAERSCAVI